MKHYGAVFATKAVLFALGIADVVASWWLTNLLTFHRPPAPHGIYVRPYQAHGSVTYISNLDYWTNIAPIGVALFLALSWWLVMRREKHLDGR